MDRSFNMYDKAISTMLKAHNGQYMKNDEKLPYAYHCLMVRQKALELTKGCQVDEDIISTVALLHDTLEDTDVTYEYLKENFGDKVADIVKALSKNYVPICDNYLDIYLDNIQNCGLEAVLVKTADRIINISQIVPQWTKAKNLEYLQESYKIYDMVSQVNDYLANKLIEQIQEFKDMIKVEKKGNEYEYKNK